MTSAVRYSVLVAMLASPVVATGAQNEPAAAATVAFTNVSVLPMDSERVLANQTVVVRDGRIAWMGAAAAASLPDGTTQIDGRGKFLMPGLAEMHAHIPGGNAPTELVHDIMFLYVANGVTTIRGMLGAPNQLTLREQTRTGEVLGPTIFVGAPSLNGNSAANPDTAATLVRAHKAAGYDFLKLHPGLTAPVYDAIVNTAREAGITFAGHVSAGVGLERTLAARQSTIDHLDGYFEMLVPHDVLARAQSGQAPFSEVIRAARVDDAAIRQLAADTRAAGVWNVPTAYLWESFYLPATPQEIAARPEMRYVPRQMVDGWNTQKRNRVQADRKNGVTPDDVRIFLDARRRILKALSDANAGLLMGTDSPQMFNVPGFALHREVALMAEAGVPAYTILASGTRNVALYAEQDLGMANDFGTVAVGMRADLVLLDANPLDDVANLARRAGVMVRGRWLPAAELDAGLEKLAAKHAGPG